MQYPYKDKWSTSDKVLKYTIRMSSNLHKNTQHTKVGHGGEIQKYVIYFRNPKGKCMAGTTTQSGHCGLWSNKAQQVTSFFYLLTNTFCYLKEQKYSP